MSGFSAEWLALREPYDLRARSDTVFSAVVAYLQGKPRVRIVDLACGTGATLRALGPRLAAPQEWRLVDNDRALLRRAARTPHASRITISVVPLDLDRDLEGAFEGATELVTTSALLDLVSQSWLTRLAAVLSARALPLYAALSYNGCAVLTPDDPFDAEAVAAINAHQRTDKGFGPALGPHAVPCAAEIFEAHGYEVVQSRSDWAFTPNDRDIQREIIASWAAAARAILPTTSVTAWAERRNHFITTGASTLRIGHVDLFASPMRTR